MKIMKNGVWTMTFSILSSIGMAQSVEPQVIASSGTSYAVGSDQLSFTIGEPLITTYAQGANIITQGFHQPHLLVTAVEPVEMSDLSILAFPNPTSNVINIKIDGNTAGLNIGVYDLNGRMLMCIPYQNGQLQTIDLSHLAAATYSLRITEKNLKPRSTHLIQKTN